MKTILRDFQRGFTALAVVVVLVGAAPNFVAFAQTAQLPAATSVALSESTIKALQDSLNKQGIAVTVDGVLNDATRAAIRKYQSQHHVPVTGEPDKETLDKLGVRQSAVPAQSQVLAQAMPPSPGASPSAPAQTPSPPTPDTQMQPGQGSTAMSCPMMQGQTQAMMQMMQGMQGMMQMMQRQMQPGQAQPGQIQPGQNLGSAPMSCPMMQGQMQAMMQMMQRMQGMMQMMQGMMQPGQTQPGQMQPGAR